MTALMKIWWEVLCHLGQASAVVLLIFGLAWTVRRGPARVVGFLWTLALTRLFLPWDLLARLGRDLMAGIVRAGHVPGTADAARQVLTYALDPVSSLGITAPSSHGWVALALTLFWLLGVGRALWSWTAEELRQRTDRRRSVGLDVLTPTGRSRLEPILRKSGTPKSVVAIGRGRGSPYVHGLISPRIFLPRELVETCPPNELEAIVLHEEAHRRRREPLRFFFLRIAGALLFFYPLVPVLRARLRRTAELLCDEWVLSQGVPQEVYMSALARSVRFGLSRGFDSTLAGTGGSFVRERLKRMQSPPRRFSMSRHAWIPLLSVLLVGGSFFLAVPLSAHFQGMAETRSVAVPAADSPVDSPAKSPAEKAPADSIPGWDEAPILVHLPAPVYPETERHSGVEGDVILRCLVTTAGGADSLQAVAEVSDHPALTESAKEALRHSEWKPARKDGRAIAVWVQVPFRFALDAKKADKKTGGK